MGSCKRAAALQDFMVPLGELEDEEAGDGGIFLTHRLAIQVLRDLGSAGKKASAREDVMAQWGFDSAAELEAALKAAIARDKSDKLQEMKDEWLRRLMKGT